MNLKSQYETRETKLINSQVTENFSISIIPDVEFMKTMII